LHASPINVADFMRQHLFGRVDTAVLSSATLSIAGKMNYYLERIGAGQGTPDDLPRLAELAQRIRDVFGDDSIRVAKNHSKFFLLDTPGPDGWKIVCRTSMNLNFNPRFENFQIAHDPELFDFHAAILDSVWHRQRRDLQDATPYSIHQHFDRDL
jgi:hypothetical protein